MSRGGLRERHRGGGGRKGVRGGGGGGGGDLGKSGNRENENGDTCVFVDAVLSSMGLLRLGGGAAIEVRARRVAFVATLSRGPGL